MRKSNEMNKFFEFYLSTNQNCSSFNIVKDMWNPLSQRNVMCDLNTKKKKRFFSFIMFKSFTQDTNF